MHFLILLTDLQIQKRSSREWVAGWEPNGKATHLWPLISAKSHSNLLCLPHLWGHRARYALSAPLWVVEERTKTCIQRQTCSGCSPWVTLLKLSHFPPWNLYFLPNSNHFFSEINQVKVKWPKWKPNPENWTDLIANSQVWLGENSGM